MPDRRLACERKELGEFVPWHDAGPQGHQVRRYNLTIDESQVECLHVPGQTQQCYLRCIRPGAEHRFAKKHFADAESIEAARKAVVIPNLYRMGPAIGMQLLVGCDHVAGYPGALFRFSLSGTGANDRAERPVEVQFCCRIPQNLAQSARDMQVLRSEDAAWIG